jgi:hypothetical protein
MVCRQCDGDAAQRHQPERLMPLACLILPACQHPAWRKAEAGRAPRAALATLREDLRDAELVTLAPGATYDQQTSLVRLAAPAFARGCPSALAARARTVLPGLPGSGPERWRTAADSRQERRGGTRRPPVCLEPCARH